MPLRSLDGTYARSWRRPVNPHSSQAKRPSGKHVMINALADVQDAVCGDADAGQREFENLQRWLVGSRLLGRNDLVKFDSQLRLSADEEVVVHIGNNGQSEMFLKFPERAHRVRPRFPMRQRLWQRLNFGFCCGESKLFAELPYDRLQHFAITAILSLLGASFEVAVKPQDGGIVRVLAVGRKNAVKAAKDSLLPVDQGPVAVEGEDLEAVEIYHLAAFGDLNGEPAPLLLDLNRLGEL